MKTTWICVALAVLVAPVVWAQTTRPTAAPAGAPLLDLTRMRVIDMTHAFDERTPYWPNSPSGFELKTLAKGPTEGGWFYSSYSLCAPEHGGTHLDAPMHFAQAGWSTDRIPVERLLGPAVVIDVSEQAASNADYRLAPGDVQRFEARHGAIPQGAMVLLRTGWERRYPDRKRYFGDDTPGSTAHLHFPSYGAEAAEFLIAERKIAGLGVDTASIDHGPASDFPVHRIAAKANVLGFENLRLAELPVTGAFVIALPMKIKGGSGGPLRMVALARR
jgi:kynurenine formamidase